MSALHIEFEDLCEAYDYARMNGGRIALETNAVNTAMVFWSRKTMTRIFNDLPKAGHYKIGMRAEFEEEYKAALEAQHEESIEKGYLPAE